MFALRRFWMALWLPCCLWAAAQAQVPGGQDSAPPPQVQPARGLKLVGSQAGKQGPVRKIAICIGIDGYHCPNYPPLHCCQNDALCLGRKFKALQYQDVIVMTDTGADINNKDQPDPQLIPTYDNLGRLLDRLPALANNPDDTLIISYSGHGNVDDQSGQSVLIPLDYADQTSNPITFGRRQDALNRCAAQRKLLILDCCRSAEGQPEMRMADGFLGSFKMQKTFMVLTGCGENQSSIEDASTSHGRLTQTLLEGLDGPAYDHDHHPEFLYAAQWCMWVQDQFKNKGWAPAQSPQFFGQISAAVEFDVSHRELPKPPPLTDAGRSMLTMCLSNSQDAWRKHQFPSAIDFANVALQIQDQNADALALKALAFQSDGDRNDALQFAESARTADSNQLMAIYVQAKDLFQDSKHMDESLPLFRAVLEGAQADPARWPLLASAEIAADCHESAGYILLNMRQYGDAVSQFTSVIGMPGAPAEQRAMAFINRGMCFENLNRDDLAAQDNGSAIAITDAPPQWTALALLNRGIAYNHLGSRKSAINDFTSVIEQKNAPTDDVARALVDRGDTYDDLGQFQIAIDDYSRVIDKMPDAPPEDIARALVNRGVAYKHLGRRPKEIEDETRVLQMANAPDADVAQARANRDASSQKVVRMQDQMAGATTVMETKEAAPTELAMADVGSAGKGYEDSNAVAQSKDATLVASGQSTGATGVSTDNASRSQKASENGARPAQ